MAKLWAVKTDQNAYQSIGIRRMKRHKRLKKMEGVTMNLYTDHGTFYVQIIKL